VSDFGLARVKESEEEAGTTNQSFGPVGVRPVSLPTTHSKQDTTRHDTHHSTPPTPPVCDSLNVCSA
jgi:hypothetical protein